MSVNIKNKNRQRKKNRHGLNDFGMLYKDMANFILHIAFFWFHKKPYKVYFGQLTVKHTLSSYTVELADIRSCFCVPATMKR